MVSNHHTETLADSKFLQGQCWIIRILITEYNIYQDFWWCSIDSSVWHVLSLNRIGFITAMAANVTNQSRNVLSKKMMTSEEVRNFLIPFKYLFVKLITALLDGTLWHYSVDNVAHHLTGKFGPYQSLWSFNNDFLHVVGSICHTYGGCQVFSFIPAICSMCTNFLFLKSLFFLDKKLKKRKRC